MSKSKSLNWGKWKEFRYGLMTENYDDAPGSPEDDPNASTYQLTDGRTLVVSTQDYPGMAGEPMTIVDLSIDGKTVRFQEIKNLLNTKDANELNNFIEDISDDNAENADRWVR